ncbi:hypothetical protein ACT7C3_10690 [Bacillus pacificus]
MSSFCFHEVLPSERKKACEEVYRIVKKEGEISSFRYYVHI